MMKKCRILLLGILAALILLSGGSELKLSVHAVQNDPVSFSCGANDTQGNLLNGYWSEKDQTWYLFVTSVQPIPDVVLQYTGEVSSVSSGQLDPQTKTVTGAFAENKDLLELQMSDGTKQTVVIMQSGLPSVHVKLNGTTLEKIHEDKDTKHKGNSIYIMDPAGEYDLAVEDTLEIKGRGNSTWRLYDKKAYQIKFDEKTSVMGMGKAKKWVLMANASDDSMLRTKLTYDMAENLDMAFVPDMEFVDLWIDGEYRGLFMIGEKVEPGSSRLDLTSDYGALFEHDDLFYMEEDYWLRSDTMDHYFVLKEIVEEDEQIIASAMDSFKGSVEELMNYLYDTPSKQVTLEDLSAMIDVDSFAKYYLVNEYVLNSESIVTSFYWYQDGPEDVLHLGPLWDFDTCMGNNGRSYSTFPVGEHVLFRYLLAAPAFRGRVQQLWEEYEPYFTALPENARQLKAAVDTSAEMNYKRWDVLGKPNPKDGFVFCSTYEEAVSTLCDWLEGRQAAFGVRQTAVANGMVSDDCSVMDICFADDMPHDSVRFAVWSMESEMKKVFWYEAVQDASGNWTAQVDLARHASAGMYSIDVYTDGSDVPAFSGFSYVREAKAPLYRTAAEFSADSMTVTLADSDLCQQVFFAVWSQEVGPDGQEWYAAERNREGLWESTVPLDQHGSAGAYEIHAYSQEDGEWILVDYAQAEAAAVLPEEPVEAGDTKVVAVAAVVAVLAAAGCIVVNYRRKKRR